MSKEIIYIGSSPYGQECAQVGSHGYAPRAKAECSAFINQLKRVYKTAHEGKPIPESVDLCTKAFRHDYGTYYEVVAFVESEDTEAFDAALWLEGNGPEMWDAEALKELAEAGSYPKE